MALSLTESLAVVALEKKLPFTVYKTLGEWLGCYKFIPRPDREVSTILVHKVLHQLNVITPGKKRTSSEVFQAWLYLDMLETTLTVQEQTRIAIWMNDSKRSVTLIDLSYTPVHANSNLIG